MTFDPHADMPHEPAPPEPRHLLPEPGTLLRGLGLMGLAAGTGALALAAWRVSWLLSPLSVVLGGSSFLAAWGAAIHLTGGEKFDDHPFI